MLFLHAENDLSGFPDPASPMGALMVELVAVCLQWRPLQHQDFKVLYGGAGHYDGVLWVKWFDGDAYRKVSGYVKKQTWEEHGLEDVHLVLG